MKKAKGKIAGFMTAVVAIVAISLLGGGARLKQNM